jgi:hydrogenase maturation protease
VATDGSRVLVAGVGNIFLGDDAFGVEVLRQLEAGPPAPGVRMADFGIRGFDLAYALLEEWDLAIFVDAATRGEPPGTLYVLRPDATDPAAAVEAQGHGMNLPKVFAFARTLGRLPERMILVGCEPSPPGGEEVAAGLSDVVRSAVGPAAALVRAFAVRALRGDFPGTGAGGGLSTERGRTC